MKKKRIRTEREYLARGAACIKIKNNFSLDAVPRMLDFNAEATMRHDRFLPKENKIRIYISADFDLKLKNKIEEGTDQLQITIPISNAEELIEQWTKALKRYKQKQGEANKE